MVNLLKYKKILIVEDDEVNSYLIGVYLDREGCDSAVARSGNEGLRLLEIEMFDVIILDLHMKHMSGYEFLRIARNLNIDIPVIITSAYTRKTELESPVIAYLVKPISEDGLISEIKNIFKETIRETDCVEDIPKDGYTL